ncbi:hypothetical protein, partial [Thermomonas sp.]|uniref:hypothetical protein n=1 Tax=Thermomonas sp. TaxID=1971895 RepID=UPI002486D659
GGSILVGNPGSVLRGNQHRDRFAASLMRYRVRRRSATAQSGLTQVLGVLMKQLILLTLLVLLFSACSTTRIANQCQYDRDAMLSLDEDSFDQDLSNSGGGWRSIGNIKGCELAAAQLISAYRAKHPSSSSVLAWHEGQMLASANQYSRAIPLFEIARKDPAEDKAGWNHYVDATVAFLRRDKVALIAAKEKLAATPYPEGTGMPPIKNGYIEFPAQPGQPVMRIHWPPNIDVVEGLINCFDKSYIEADGTSCRPTPPDPHT